MIKHILCYGDSNTWGYSPQGQQRHEPHMRWPGVLRQTLGDGYHVSEAGLNGRTTVFDDPIQDDANGKTYLPVTLHTHKPLDLVIIMLGTNDLKSRLGVSAYDIALGMQTLVQIVLDSRCGRNDQAPAVLMVSPPPVHPDYATSPWAEEATGALEKSRKLAGYYAHFAEQMNVTFFDAGSVAASSPLDAIHLEAADHAALGAALAPLVREIVPL
jgi:lysophospholipase L1-like esterase